MILAIDAGNSRMKWGIFHGLGELKEQGVITNSALASSHAPDAWQGCTSAVISNVAGESVAGSIKGLLKAQNIPSYSIKSSAQACNVINGYQLPEKLGTDRWAALIAAWDQYHAPCVVVNAGTALTVDALGVNKDGRGIFLGGLIVPGLRLMEQSLTSATADISHTSGRVQYFPTSTGDAIYTGALSAMAGAVNSMLVKLEHHAGQVPCCILSGGDAPLLQDMLVRYQIENMVLAENLVLQGLVLLEKEMGKGA
ncbi:MAG TPA: type III pantothenate kinase [Methylophilaceae bacterium]|nr:type III pantothenate kinase [Methylophilaceae bacterium]